jgi:hypothetical protein
LIEPERGVLRQVFVFDLLLSLLTKRSLMPRAAEAPGFFLGREKLIE